MPEMTLPMDKSASARPVNRPDPAIADLARSANGVGEPEEAVNRGGLPMAGLVTAGFWNMAALSLAGMSVAATTAARVWSLGSGRRDGEDV
ncbi:hypothetical protein [Antarctobacter jejuensis]|uniref:hypothetical protein n=1 Tax=Antarctobacter jejuensis TaxID=1439938 RepID=UPI003FD13871